MENNDVPELVTMALNKLNSIPGANKIFFERFKKKRPIVYFWKSGRTKPSLADFNHFMELVTEVINECDPKLKMLESKTEKAKIEFKNLLSV